MPSGDEWTATTAIENIAPQGVTRCHHDPLSAVVFRGSDGDTPSSEGVTSVTTSPEGVTVRLVGPRIIRDGVTRRRGTDGRWHVVTEVSK